LEAEASISVVPTLEADRSIYDTCPWSDVNYLNPQDLQQMRNKYSKAHKRLILLGFVSQKEQLRHASDSYDHPDQST
jgi:hypothetical protein